MYNNWLCFYNKFNILKKNIKLKIVLSSLLVLVSLLFIIIDKYANFKSPDEHYSISVYRLPLLFAAIGGGSDVPGLAVLTNRIGFPLRVCMVDMVQNVSPPEWNGDEVSMKFVFDWDLK